MNTRLFIIALFSFSFFSVSAQNKIVLADFPESPSFSDARLSISDVKATEIGDSVKIAFSFDVKNYQLAKQTDDASGKMCSNSDKGQHIHFIIDNRPYVALYEPHYEITVAKNTEHYVLCFLSRSYHESIKHKGASVFYHFKTEANGNVLKLKEPKTPMVFYSRPKGDYFGKDASNVLFDFYLWNTHLGNHCKLLVYITSGNSISTMTIDKWKAYSLKNLSMGKNNIRLTLIDKNGDIIKGPFTESSRDFNLAEQEGRK